MATSLLPQSDLRRRALSAYRQRKRLEMERERAQQREREREHRLALANDLAARVAAVLGVQLGATPVEFWVQDGGQVVPVARIDEWLIVTPGTFPLTLYVGAWRGDGEEPVWWLDGAGRFEDVADLADLGEFVAALDRAARQSEVA